MEKLFLQLITQMKTIRNLKKCALEMATLLAQDDTIKKLLITDTEKALQEPVPDYPLNRLLEEHYVSIYPPVENRIEEYYRNTFLSILLDTIIGQDYQTGNYLIYVSTDTAHVSLINNQDRLLELVDRVCNILDGTKLTSAGEVSVTSVAYESLSDLHPAYRISVHVKDQVAPKGDL